MSTEVSKWPDSKGRHGISQLIYLIIPADYDLGKPCVGEVFG